MLKKIGLLLTALFTVVGIAVAGIWLYLHPSPAELEVWHNASILTLNKQQPRADALAMHQGRIIAVGRYADMRPYISQGAKTLDLQGKTVLPGFIEAHGHFPGSGLTTVTANLNSPPIHNIRTIADIQSALRTLQHDLAPDAWLVGMGYDDTLLRERRHPTRADLDSISTTRPIYIIHVSGHMGVANSAALTALNITATTPNPSGGEIKRDAQGQALGLLLETAHKPAAKRALTFSPWQQLQVIQQAGQDYAAQGFTTVQNGLALPEHIAGLANVAKLGLIKQRLVLWPEQQLGLDWLDNKVPDLNQYASDKVHIGAIKFVADGSIQGYTGYLRQPYYQVRNKPASYRGYPSLSQDDLIAGLIKAHCKGRQVAIHGNGDAAIDNIMAAWQLANHQCPRHNARPLIIHAQMARNDQLRRMKKLNMSPSFFAAHTYYWGDRHRDIFLGSDRAKRISPLASAARYNLRFTTHLDTPVVPIDSMFQLWTAMQRETSSGKTLGYSERITAQQSLQAMTIDAAWQLFLDDKIGSIEVGKQADLVVLSGNPLGFTSPVRDITVLQTVVGGVTIYEKNISAL